MTLPEPRQHALIACQIQVGFDQTWTKRTYEAVRTDDGLWRIDFGAGLLEPRRDWAAVLAWLRLLAPRDVELLEVP